MITKQIIVRTKISHLIIIYEYQLDFKYNCIRFYFALNFETFACKYLNTLEQLSIVLGMIFSIF